MSSQIHQEGSKSDQNFEKGSSWEDEYIDSLELDEQTKTEIQKMSRVTAIRKYLHVLRSVKRLEEENKLLKEEQLKSKEREMQAVFLSESIRKKHEPQTHEVNYNHNWTWINKIAFILKRCDRPMKSMEIVERLIQCDPNVKRMYEPQKELSAYFNKAVKYQRIYTYKINGIRGYYYFLAEWMKDGKFSEEYLNKISIYK